MDFYRCKFEENKSVPVGGGGGGIYCAVQKEKVCGHVTMVAKFLGEFAALFTNTRSLVPSSLCTDVPPPSVKIGRRDVCESLTIIVFLFPRNVGDGL